jgi:hypothetical protein
LRFQFGRQPTRWLALHVRGRLVMSAIARSGFGAELTLGKWVMSASGAVLPLVAHQSDVRFASH